MSNQYNWDEKSKLTWDKYAAYWKDSSESRWLEGSRKDIIPFIEKHIPKQGKLLDIGCGPGVSTDLFRKAGYDASGTDISSEMIQIAQESFPEINFHVDNIASFSEVDKNTYDSAVLINVIEWTEIPLHAVEELRRIIKKDGYICAAILGPTAGPRANSYRRLYGEAVIQNTMMPWEFERLAEEQQLEVIDQFYVYRKGVDAREASQLKKEMKQALSFMTVFMLRNRKGEGK